ncbi:MAG TPA: ATP-binding protein [Rhodothermales bacterium]|nr:ATP-binding protein [Rhodothermales bacterium]
MRMSTDRFWGVVCSGMVLLVGLFLVSIQDVSAQSATSLSERVPGAGFLSYRLDEWTIGEGLPGHVSHLAVGQNGYLWITTWEGLVRFDGHRFTVYNLANTPAFSTQAFTRLYASHAGEIWFGAKNGMVYQYKEGVFIEHDVLHGTASGWISAFAEDASGRMWVSTTQGRIASFDGQNWTLHPQRIRDSWAPFGADASGRIWTYLPGTPQTPSDFVHFSNGIPARLDRLGFLPQPSPETLGFVKTQHGPLFHRPRGSLEVYRRERRIRMDLLDAQGTLLGWYWHTPGAVGTLIDSHGRVWVRLESKGAADLLHVYKEGVLLARIQAAGIGWVDVLEEDREGNIWFKAKGSGLFRIQVSPFTQYTPTDGLIASPAYVAASPSGDVLVSSRASLDRDKVTVFQGSTLSNRQFRLRGTEPGLSSSPFATLGLVQVDTKGQWWGVSYNHLLRLREDIAESVWRSDQDNISSFYRDPANPDYLWLGTSTGDLYRFNTRTLATESAYKVGMSDIGHLFRDSQQTLWISTQDQLARLEKSGTLTVFEEEAVSRVQVSAFYEDADGTLWIGTHDKGLVRYRDGRFQSLRAENGLFENTITSIFEDPFGFFWMSGNLGLQRVRFEELNAVLDGQARRVHAVGLPPQLGHFSADPTMRGAVQDDTGALWYPALRGVTRVDPALYQAGFAIAPVVTIEAVRSEQATHSAHPDLILSPQERRLTFSYGAISLRAANLLHFRYRLDGVDQAWIEAGDARSATYTNIEPGRYTFRVQAMNGGGVWSEADAVLTFSVQPFFYETVWFYLLSGLGLLTLGIVGFSYRLRYYKQRQVELDHLVQARTHELAVEKQNVEQALQTVAEQSEQLQSLDEAKSRFFANISHEFRTPLLLILGPLEDLRDGLQGTLSEEAHEQVALAHRNSHRLLHLVNQLLDVSRLETGRLTLQVQHVDAVAFANRVAETFASMAKRKHIDFQIDAPDEPLRVYFDPDQLEKVLTNLLGNAFKFSPRESTVTLCLTTEDDSFVVAVQDTGPGIAPEHLPHLFERFYQADASSTRRQPGTGIGLALAKELVSLHHGTIEVASEEGKGSTFTVRLPLGHAHFLDEELADPAGPASPLPSQIQNVNTANVWLDEIEVDDHPVSGDGATGATALVDGEDVTTILVVDDNADVRAYMRRHLENKYRVVEAINGKAALEQTRTVLPDLIVSDVMMPEMGGFAFCTALKQDPELDFIPVILLTAKASPESKIAGLEEGADDYLTKPFDVRELIARIENLIASRQRLKARFSENASPSLPVLASPHRAALTASDQAFTDQFQQVLDAHLSDENIAVSDLAEAMGVGRSTLYRRVQEVHQQSPMELLWQLRLQHAAHLLRQPDINVSEVAYGVGFRSVAHFSTRFSEQFGVSPSTFRAQPQTEA